MARLKYEEVANEMAQKGWKLVEQEYNNLDTEMEMICPEGHKVKLSFKNWRRNFKCPVCENNPLKKEVTYNKEKGKTRILALDQATSVSGWSIFDNKQLIHYGKIDMGEEEKENRILHFIEWLIEMVAKWKPDYIAIEDIQLQLKNNDDAIRNVQVFKTLAQLQGAIILLCKMKDISLMVVPVATWRNFCEIKGKYRADRKKSAQIRIKEWYDVSVTQDEADAICIGKYVASKIAPINNIIEWQ